MRSGADDARALMLFERLIDAPSERDTLLSGELPTVLAALFALEAAAPRARAAFPTEEDALPRRRLLPMPDHVGAYRLGPKLGEGGMGLVFAADRADGLFEHRVAIKLIHPDRFCDRALDRFAQERRLLARLDHPGIARLIDGGVAADGWPYIIMERADGVPLDVRAAAEPMLKRRVGMVEQVCDAVRAAHTALVVHGDLKPGNVLVETSGRTRLLDFGVAQLVDAPAPASTLPMTLAYASPAVRAGAVPAIPDDIYALGVMLRAVANAGGDDAHRRAPADRDLAAIAAKATAADPARRYLSMDGLAEDLARWQAGRPVTARVATLRYLTARFVVRNRRRLALAALAGLALVLLAGLALAGWRAAGHTSRVAAERTIAMRQLARGQLLALADRLEHQPRSTALRRDLVRDTEHVLARASIEGDASPELKRDAAEGYRLLARIEGAPTRPSLGHPERALASLDRAGALLAGSSTVADREARMRVLLDRAEIQGAANDVAGAMASLARARALRQSVSPLLADDLALLTADIMIWNGAYAPARALALRVAMRHQGAPADPDEALRQDRILDRQAEAAYYLGDEHDAARLYRAAIVALAHAGDRWPNDAALGWALARQRWNLATTLIELHRQNEALPLLRQASAVMARAVADDPDDMVAMRRLRSYELATAQALAATGRTQAAIRLLHANLIARRAWAAASPRDVARQRDLAIGVAALGDLHADAGQRAAACALYGEVHAIHAALARQRRLAALDAGYFEGLIRANERKLACP